jgi:hypothetical protein
MFGASIKRILKTDDSILAKLDIPLFSWQPNATFSYSHLMSAGADVFGLFSNNVVSFSRNVVPSGPLFSTNLVPEQRCFWAEPFMFSGRYT